MEFLDLASARGKEMLRMATEWIEESHPDPKCIDIVDIILYEGRTYLEANCFEAGKYYVRSIHFPEAEITQKSREKKIGGLGI